MSFDQIGPILIGALIGLLINYLIIQSAVKSALASYHQEQINLLHAQNRLLSLMLKNQGVSKDDIFAAHDVNNQDYWNKF